MNSYYVVYNSAMELANHWTAVQNLCTHIRVATETDRPDVFRLMQTAHLQHMHLDWKPPGDWLGAPGFVILPTPSDRTATVSARLFSPPPALQACLAAVPDPGPAAWVRLACIRRDDQTGEVLQALLYRAEQALRETAVTQLAWLPIAPWPNAWLPACGFAAAAELMTYVKPDLAIPDLPWPLDVALRPAEPADVPALAAVEEAAFAPLWRYSADALQHAFQQAAAFDVAEWNGRVVGFQFSTIAGNNAHLARMAVQPDVQGRGVGRALLAAALRGYRARGVRTVSLNTQVDNAPSRTLYERFGFGATAQRLPVWVKQLD